MHRSLTIGFGLGLAAASAFAATPGDCLAGEDFGARFTACTALIASGDWSGRELAALHAARATTYRTFGEPQKAIDDLDIALRLAPDMASAYADRGNAYQDLGQYPRAIGDYDRALDLDPGNMAVISNRAGARCGLGAKDGAVADWHRVIDAGFWKAADAQDWLRAQGFYKGKIDGKFGRRSRAALKAWVAAGCP